MSIDAFLKLGDIKGESVAQSYEDAIDVLAWSWGATNSGSVGKGGGGGAGKADFAPLNITKYVDKASPNLIQKLALGKHYPTASLHICKAGDGKQEYLTIEFEEVLVESVSVGGSEGDEFLVENVSLIFGKIKYTYKPQKPDGSLGGAVEAQWNIATNSES